MPNLPPVAVVSRGIIIDWAKERPARKLPNGYLGIIYRKSAWPVYRNRTEGFSIDLSDVPFEKSECTFLRKNFVCIDDKEPEHDIEYEEVDSSLDDEKETIPQNVSDIMKALGADWLDAIGQEELRELVQNQNVVPIINWLIDSVTAERESVEYVRDAAQTKLDLEKSRSHKLAEKFEKAKNIKDKLVIENALLDKKIKSKSAIIQRLSAGAQGSSSNDAKIIRLEEESKYFEKEYNTIAKKYEQAKEKISQSNIQIEKLKSEIKEREYDSVQPNKKDRVYNIIQIFLSCFGNIEFRDDAATIIYRSFSKLDALFKILTKLNNGENVPHRSIQGKPNWLEYNGHVSTGKNSRGRIYFKSRRNDSLLVVVHCKKDDKEQTKFLSNL